MTRSVGGGGPEWEPRDKEPELREDSPEWERKLDGLSRYSKNAQTAITPVRVDAGRRLVAAIIDIAAANVIAVVIGMLPFINVFLPYQLIMVLFLLVRDFFFAGRGIGKNLMGLQVVDVMTGAPCSIVQSIQRNIIILGPILALFVLVSILKFVPIPAITDTAMNIINLVGTIYTLAVIPYEVYRVYARADGLRFGDQLAGTALVEAPMDFSKPVPRQ